ncbi:hypothetical protein AYJ58_06295 [Shewanella sp. Pdp11]|nr:hypothetical protein AYJ58_06295 [Shewanella sp. Pdp11]
MINKLRGIFDNKVVKRFQKKKVSINVHSELEFVEGSSGAALRTLSIIHNGVLIDQQLRNTLIIEADFINGEHSKYSSFVKNDAFFLTKQCDFFIFHQNGNQLYIAICDMKSSKAGDDERCAQQIEHAKLFLTYIVESAIQSEKYKVQASEAIEKYIFIKLLFIPSDNLPMAMALPLDLSTATCNPKFNTNGITNFHLLEMENTMAREQWASIEQRFPS